MRAYAWFGMGALVLMSVWDIHEATVLADLRQRRVALELKAEADSVRLQQSKRELQSVAQDAAEAEKQLAELLLFPAQSGDQGNSDVPSDGGWVARVRRLKELCEERADQRIPEMVLLTDDDWVRVARDAKFETSDDQRRTLAAARSAAKGKFLLPVTKALQVYMAAHDGKYPEAVVDLMPYFETPPDPAAMSRYEVYAASRTAGNRVAVREKTAIDPEFDSRYSAIPNGGVLSQGGDDAWKQRP